MAKPKPITDEVIAAAYAKRCRKCKYRGPEHSVQCCDYILITGQMRGCSIANCDKFVKGKRMRVGQTPDNPIRRKRREIVKPQQRRGGRRPGSAKTEIGGLIDAYVQTKEICMKDFAELIGASRLTVINWRRGKYVPGEPMLRRISAVIGVDVEDLREMSERDKDVKERGQEGIS